MGVTDQLNKPSQNAHKMGRFTLNRIFLCDPTVGASAAVTPTNLENIIAIDIGDPSFDYEADVLQQGAGQDKTQVQFGPRWDGTITVLSGNIGDVIASLKDVTWGSSHVALSLRRDNDLPNVIWEAICRTKDNSTHLFSYVIQDMIIDNIVFENPMDYADGSIPFHTYHEPFLIYTGYEMAYDVWNGTGTPFTMTSTPASLLTASNHDDWNFDNAVYIKNKDNSESDSGMTRRLSSGVSIVGKTVTFTAGSPEASDKLAVLYAKAS